MRNTLKKSSRTRLLLFALGCAWIVSGCSGGESASAPQATAPRCTSGSVAATPTPAATADLSWDAVTAANLSGYRIYYGITPGVYSQPAGQGVDAGNTTQVTVAGLARGVRYYFAVRAYDASGFESGDSNVVCKDV
jgi:fibronectin type 3 domain-containing protein